MTYDSNVRIFIDREVKTVAYHTDLSHSGASGAPQAGIGFHFYLT